MTNISVQVTDWIPCHTASYSAFVLARASALSA